MPLRSIAQSLKALVGGLYLLVFLEAFYMVSFFGIYLASVYAPVERLLDHHPATSWLLSFYLPHFYHSSVGLLNIAVYLLAGSLIWFVGFWVFFYSALQIYGTKLTVKTAITRGLYRRIRHPQYLAFMIMPLPFLIIWPRYLLLGMYVLLLAFYLTLARREEQQCLERFGPAYGQYRAATAMFLPGLKVEQAFSAMPLSLPQGPILRRMAVTGLAVAATAVTLAAAVMVEKVWTAKIPQLRETATLWVPMYGDDGNRLENIMKIAYRDRPLQEALEGLSQQGAQSFYVLVLPLHELHFFVDYAGSLVPEVPWSGDPTPEYWASPRLPEVPRYDFRSLLFFTCEAPLPETDNPLLAILLKAGHWRPRYMAGIDLEAGEVLSRVLLQEAPQDSQATLRLPML